MPYPVRLDPLIYIFRNIALSMNLANQADMVATGNQGRDRYRQDLAMLRRADRLDAPARCLGGPADRKGSGRDNDP